MGLKFAQTSTTDIVRTVCIHDSAIDEKGSDIDAFRDNRADLSVLKLIEANPKEPWEAPCHFDYRALSKEEYAFALNESTGRAIGAGAMGDWGFGQEYMLARMCFALGVTGMDNLWRHPKDKEKGPQKVEFERISISGYGSVSTDVLDNVRTEVLVDIGSLVLDATRLDDTQKKDSG
jgi:hypothetical protein